ncbi:MAG: SpoIIE family protein phosphatase [Rhodobacteraceae bacterium]|nr:SpoIIE family protein phosphatase [Paracoccaceae bacterium]
MLVVDDSAAQRGILRRYLSRMGYEMIDAESGAEALDILALDQIDLVISDWMMPEMDGLEFCHRFRQMERRSYGYFILLTSKADKAEIARGLDMGADDFLTKPVSPEELRARIAAGERVLDMQCQLHRSNRDLGEALAQITAQHDAVERDLREARKLQQSLLRETERSFDGAEVAMLLHPAGHVGGDLVGCFPAGPDHLVAYAVDVSGHGVASALMAARIAAHLSGSEPEQNMALARNPDGSIEPLPPARLARRLNAMMLADMETDLYFTMVLSVLDLASGDLRVVQAGHPHPILHRAYGEAEKVGHGGLPIGLLADVSYREAQLSLSPGDRLVLFTDGITECRNSLGAGFGRARLRDFLAAYHGRAAGQVLDGLLRVLTHHAGQAEFEDDVSAVVLDYLGPS